MANNALFRDWFEKEYAAAAPERQAVMTAQLDRMAECNLGALFASGFYDRGPTSATRSPVFEKHKEVARRTAEGAICLLKNEGNILPLKAGQKILYVGEDEIHTGSGSGRVAGYDHVSYRAALKTAFGESITFATPEKVTDGQFKAADVVLCNINKEGGEARDIPFELPRPQREQIERILGFHSNVVMLVTACNGFDMPWIGKVRGMLWCYYLGQERGTAVAEIVSGRLSPSGKLPMTIEKQFADSVAPAYNYIGGKPFWSGDTSYRAYWLTGEINEKTAQPIREQFIPNVKPREVLHVPYAEGIYMGYRWYDKRQIEPRFPFGHGLSYATFAYSGLTVKPSGDPRYPVSAGITLKNTGSMTAKEVVQIYVTDCESTVEQAVKELAGYLKIELRPGETRTVTIPLCANGFKYFDEKTNQWILEPGTFEIKAGSSSQDIRLKTTIRL
jgi:beta-glucosidase